MPGAFGLGLTNLPNQGQIDPRQWSQEFQAVGEALDGRARYVAGVYYYEENVDEVQGHNRSNYVTMNDIISLRAIGPVLAALGALGEAAGAQLQMAAEALTGALTDFARDPSLSGVGRQ